MRLRTAIAAALCVASTVSVPCRAQDADEKKLGWFNTTELSLVNTSGNSQSDTFSFKASANRVWKSSDLTLTAGGLRAESTTITRSAVGSGPDDFEIVTTEATELTAEKYYLRGRYGRQIHERLQWFSAVGWERNEFAGIANRYSLGGGIGHTWRQSETSHLKTDYGLFWTREEDLAGLEDDFVVARGSWDYLRPLTRTTSFGSGLALEESLDELSDFRVDTTNWVSVAINSRLALRVSLQLLYDNQPSLVSLPLQSPGGTPTGDTVKAELDRLDTILTVGLVVHF